jgi:uncharacterized protein YgiM (DUF1202 family)
MKNRLAILVFATAALLLSACNLNAQEAVNTAIAQTQQISQLQTAAAGGGATSTPLASQTPGEPTGTATISASATSSIPYVSVSVDTHCRSGPRVDYKLLTTILKGEQVIVLATFPGNNYAIVQRPGGSGSCWLWLNYAERTDFDGYGLPVATQPPTSTPTYTPSPTFTPTATFTPSPTP